MKFPYGISDFVKIIRENYFYVDRTEKIPLLEEAGAQLLLLRPRRFGKSLLLNLLANYYDVAKAEQFCQLFGHLHIGQQPTPKHNQYLVMKWDFSTVLPMGSTAELKTAVYTYLNARMTKFVRDYSAWLSEPFEPNETDALASFEYLMSLINRTPWQLYLFIDEYDNFANEVMATQVSANQRYAELVYGEGLLKTLFKNIKSAASGNGLDRVFITGVSPVVMADMSSGYNVVTNIYRQADFNDLCGFREEEIPAVLQQIGTSCQLTDEQQQMAFRLMQSFYNGYRFSLPSRGKLPGKVYNPTLVLYFLRHLQHHCEYPDDLMDHNLAMDRNRLNYLAKLPHGVAVIENALDESKPLTVTKLHDRFGVEDMLKREPQGKELASLLYYLGVLTFDSIVGLGEIKLVIPNLVIRGLYVEKLRELLLPNLDESSYLEARKTFYLTGDLQPLCDFIETRFAVFSNRDYQWKAEMAVKTAFLMFLFDDRLYILASEPELHRRYADLTLLVRPDARQYHILDHLMEFKFLKLSEVNLSAEQVRTLTTVELQQLPLVQTAFAEAQQQLAEYQPVLQQHHSEVLQFHLSIVVAIGFERLVWQRG
jgi:hypothetical protein